jgi:hypothetical protein
MPQSEEMTPPYYLDEDPSAPLTDHFIDHRHD